MGQNSTTITSKNSAEWLASFGYLFPSTVVELTRFNKLFGEIDSSITGREVDPFKIIKSSKVVTLHKSIKSYNKNPREYKLVASNLNALPQHIIRLIKKTDNTEKDNDDITHK